MNRTNVFAALLLAVILALPVGARAEEEVFRLGMIGLDTSHVITFTSYINNPENNTGCKVVAGFKGGSKDMPISINRVDKFTKELVEKYGIEIVESIEELCEKVDGILLESVDGRPHLEQIKPVIAAGKPVFVDKPMAGNLGDVMEIFRLAKEKNVPCWSSSSLRFSPGIMKMRNNRKVGRALGCDAFGPCKYEKVLPDLYWYGVHGVEMLYTIMGPGCETVTRTHTKNYDLVVGVWKDGRIGTYRGLRTGKQEFGATVFGAKAIVPADKHESYEGLVEQIVKFFKTGEIPVPAEETIEIFAFMDAAQQSADKGGVPVSIQEIIEKNKKKTTTN